MTRNKPSLCKCGNFKHEKSKRCWECYSKKRPYQRVGLMMKNRTFDRERKVYGDCDNCRIPQATHIIKGRPYCNGCFYNLKMLKENV